MWQFNVHHRVGDYRQAFVCGSFSVCVVVLTTAELLPVFDLGLAATLVRRWRYNNQEYLSGISGVWNWRLRQLNLLRNCCHNTTGHVWALRMLLFQVFTEVVHCSRDAHAVPSSLLFAKPSVDPSCSSRVPDIFIPASCGSEVPDELSLTSVWRSRATPR